MANELRTRPSRTHETRLPEDVEQRLNALSESTGRPVAFYVREAVVEHLDHLEWAYGVGADAEAIRGQIHQSGGGVGPNTLSGKAAKARSYGIRIVTDAAFGTLLAAMESESAWAGVCHGVTPCHSAHGY